MYGLVKLANRRITKISDYGLAKIAMDDELKKKLESAFLPEGDYEEININNKPGLASQLGSLGALIGASVGSSAGGFKGGLTGTAIGGLAGAGLGYGLGSKKTYHMPIYNDEQLMEQQRLIRDYPEESMTYFSEIVG